MRRYLLILTVLLGFTVGFFGRADWHSEITEWPISVAHAQEDDDDEDDDDDGDDGSDDDGDDDGGDDGGSGGDDDDDDGPDNDDDGDGDDDDDDDDEDDDDGDDPDDDERDDDDPDDEDEENKPESGQNPASLEPPQTPPATSNREEERFVDDEIVLLTDPDWSEADRAALAAAGYGILSQTPLGGLGATIVRLSLPAGLTARQALDRARALAPTAVFDFNHVYRPSGETCSPSDCWAQDMVGLAEPTAACPDLGPIAIIDTPVATDHPALANADIVARSFVPAGSDPAAEHGTAIAALLVGQSMPGAAPLAPGARLLAAGALTDIDGETRADAIAVLQALDWAISEGAQVIGLSIEGDPNSALAFGVRVGARQASLVAAAGNGGARGEPAYPAAYTDVIAVSAIDRRLRPYRQGTRGDYVEFAAPGVDIPSRMQDGNAAAWTGSSFAVPFVAAAMLRGRAETEEDRRAARAKLAQTATDLGPPGRDRIFGHGLVQLSDKHCG